MGFYLGQTLLCKLLDFETLKSKHGVVKKLINEQACSFWFRNSLPKEIKLSLNVKTFKKQLKDNIFSSQ